MNIWSLHDVKVLLIHSGVNISLLRIIFSAYFDREGVVVF